MKKKYLAILAGLMVLCCAACGGDDDTKVVNKLPNSNNGSSSEDVSKDETGKDDKLTGYIFEADAGSETISITTDIEAAGIVAALGEPSAYFESTSCAFDGIDKMYTYDHFRIETYPDGEKDRISYIFFLDDMAETPEGICIGMTKEEVEDAYGTDYEDKSGLLVYTKDGKHLSFLIEDGVVTSIEYSSAVMDNVE